ncbi:MAG: hypothetical protein ACOZIN_04350 [Myxococcota bacterium]
MAEATVVEHLHEPVVRPPVQLSWGAIFGGSFVAATVCLMLCALGWAIGLGRVEPTEGAGLAVRGLGVWTIFAALIGLFVGGFVAARSVLRLDAWGRGLHGLVVWALTSIVALFFAWSLVASVVGGMVGLAGRAVGLTGQLVGSAEQVQQALGVSAQELIAPINERLQAQGMPPVRAEELQAALQGVVSETLRTGQFDRQLFVDSLAESTELSPEDAQDIAAQLEARWLQMREQLGSTAQQMAGQAAAVSSDFLWGLFITLLLGLVAAVGGGLLGKRFMRHRREEKLPHAVPAPPPPPREVYP